MFGHFCGLYSVLVFIFIMERSCFCLVLSPSQRDLVTYQWAMKFFTSNRRTPRPSHQSQAGSRLSEVAVVVLFSLLNLFNTSQYVLVSGNVKGFRCKVNKGPNP